MPITKENSSPGYYVYAHSGKTIFKEGQFKESHDGNNIHTHRGCITVDVVKGQAGQGIYINSTAKNAKAANISPHFLRVLDKVNKRYGSALKELAKK